MTMLARVLAPNIKSIPTWKPNSVFKSPFMALLLAQPYELLMRWYEHIIFPLPALTASWNGLFMSDAGVPNRIP